MNAFKLTHRPGIPWFSLGIAAIFLGSLALRFWGLSRFNTLVFDEVYYVKNANNYLTQTPFFDSHPPLSKYLIAIGIWISNTLNWMPTAPQNALAGSPLSTFSYRWLNAVTGATLPLVVMAIAHHLIRRRTYVLLAGLFAALDGLFLVESRYGLNNIYLVLFGLLGHWAFLVALDRSRRSRLGWLLLAGACFGACVSIKWNGLWFLLGIYLVWTWAWLTQFWRAWQLLPPPECPERPLPLQRLTEINLPTMAVYLGALPFLVYYLQWIPHLQLNPGTNFWQLQYEILDFHNRVGGNDPSVHPYCSPWYTWIWMVRPVVYFYENARTPLDAVPLSPPVPPEQAQVIFDVHAMGNPVLWWISSLGMLVLIGTLMTWPYERRRASSSAEDLSYPLLLMVYFVASYAANLLPWVRVSRCTFLYHYMGCAVFALLAAAWVLDRWLSSPDPKHRGLALGLIGLTVLAFVFWLPLYLGLPLSPTELQWRRLLPTW